MSTSAPHRFRVLWLACLALLAATLPLACRGPAAGPPDGARRTPIEKPWTKEAIESHTYLWLELSTGKRGVMTGPVLASDASGEYLTTRKDPNVHLPLADVVVMDGFTGNVILKSSETLASSIVFMLKEEIRKRPMAMAGAVLAGGAFKALKKRIDPREVGGAPLLGVSGCCVIGHGKSDALAISEGIRTAGEFSKSGINAKITAEVARLARADEAAQRATS